MLSERLFKDGVLTIDEAYETLSPHYIDIMRCINEGLNITRELRQRESEFYLTLTPRSRASMVHDYTESIAKILFGRKGKEIKVYTGKGFLVVDFYGRVFLRFKKLQHNLMPCNIETEQQKAFNEQTLFEGCVTHVTAGYRLNDLGEYKDAHIVCIAYRELLWSLPLSEARQRESTIQVASKPSVAIPRRNTSRKVSSAS